MFGWMVALCLLASPSALAAEPAAASPAPAATAWLTPYDQVRVALAKDSEPEAVAAASTLTVGELAAPAAALVAAPDLPSRRAAFAELSRVAVLRLAADPSAPKVLVYHCTMYQGYAYWVQPKAGIENPYMGAAMPDCGEQVSLKAAAKAALAD